MAQWHTDPKYPGIRWREHISRTWKRQPDRYYVLRYYRDGKRVSETLGWASMHGWTLQTVAEELQELQRNNRRGGGPRSLAEKRGHIANENAADRCSRLERERDALTFSDLADRFVEWAKHNKTTWNDDESRLRLHIKPIIGDRPATDISCTTIENLKISLADKIVNEGKANARPMAPATLVQCLTLTRHVFYWARKAPFREDTQDIKLFVGENPVRDVEFPHVENCRTRIALDEEFDAIMEEAAKDTWNSLADTILLSYTTGMREEEVATLEKQHVNLITNRVRVVDTKNGESRTVYPDERALAMLQERKNADNGSRYIFPGRVQGQHINKDHICRKFRDITDAIGLNDGIDDSRMRLVFHSLRHTFGTKMIVGGMDIETLRKIMGHKLIQTTQRYVHLADEFLHQQQVKAAMKNGKLTKQHVS